MSLRALRKLNSPTPDLNKVQDNVELALRPVLQSAILAGVQVNDVELTTSPATVSHTLGRQPQGWLLVGQNADARVWSTARDRNILTLQASAACTVSLWVY